MFVKRESVISGHLEAKKTEVRILLNIFWPGLPGRHQVWRDKKVSVKKLPLGTMLLIDTPFKKVAVEIVEPMHPE